ncbi:hypothetical protein A9P79_16285 [Cupriavidus taiwanensis]|uniref:hypothetical protein n=1 Tax=Cupriavidus taiwanensis TaxID=164546 RepID=UPI000E207878|nr:hypothetical protein [Cupriavidus taiwanensis]ULX53529.1 hypothetical protein A9P79_16285 [Cupriavidus taiwanensis]
MQYEFRWSQSQARTPRGKPIGAAETAAVLRPESSIRHALPGKFDKDNKKPFRFRLIPFR